MYAARWRRKRETDSVASHPSCVHFRKHKCGLVFSVYLRVEKVVRTCGTERVAAAVDRLLIVSRAPTAAINTHRWDCFGVEVEGREEPVRENAE